MAVVNDYRGLVAVEGHNKFLVDTVKTVDGIVSVEGPSIRWDGALAKTVRVGTLPQYCAFTDWHSF